MKITKGKCKYLDCFGSWDNCRRCLGGIPAGADKVGSGPAKECILYKENPTYILSMKNVVIKDNHLKLKNRKGE